jgi:hypothetical protein
MNAIIDPLKITENVELILENGQWPNFHDAEIHKAIFVRGNVRPDDNVWIGPQVELTIELFALEKPYIVVLLFRDCSDITMTGFSEQNAMLGLSFTREARGLLSNGEPMTPYIVVTVTKATGAELSFKCFSVSAVERREISHNNDTALAEKPVEKQTEKQTAK